MSAVQTQPAECFNSPEEMRIRLIQVLKALEPKWRPLVEEFLPWVHKMGGLLASPLAGMLLSSLGVDKQQVTRLQPLLQYLPASLDSWETDLYPLLQKIDDADLTMFVRKVEGAAAWVLRP